MTYRCFNKHGRASLTAFFLAILLLLPSQVSAQNCPTTNINTDKMMREAEKAVSTMERYMEQGNNKKAMRSLFDYVGRSIGDGVEKAKNTDMQDIRCSAQAAADAVVDIAPHAMKTLRESMDGFVNYGKNNK